MVKFRAENNNRFFRNLLFFFMRFITQKTIVVKGESIYQVIKLFDFLFRKIRGKIIVFLDFPLTYVYLPLDLSQTCQMEFHCLKFKICVNNANKLQKSSQDILNMNLLIIII